MATLIEGPRGGGRPSLATVMVFIALVVLLYSSGNEWSTGGRGVMKRNNSKGNQNKNKTSPGSITNFPYGMPDNVDYGISDARPWLMQPGYAQCPPNQLPHPIYGQFPPGQYNQMPQYQSPVNLKFDQEQPRQVNDCRPELCAVQPQSSSQSSVWPTFDLSLLTIDLSKLSKCFCACRRGQGRDSDEQQQKDEFYFRQT